VAGLARKRVLVFAAHPDDDVIGCGGSIAKHAAAGNEVSICFMTSGEAGSDSIPPEKLAAIREKEALKAARKLGAGTLAFMRNPDGGLECRSETVAQTVGLIRMAKPHVVYCHGAHDAHSDHKAVSAIASEAAFRSQGASFPFLGAPWRVDSILAFEVWSPLPEANYAEDVSAFMEKKIAALKEHRSQVQKTGFVEAARGLASYRGVTLARGRFAEAFKAIRSPSVF
jgi:LmbE family N-acetylglucosaminyl deacetylase